MRVVTGATGAQAAPAGTAVVFAALAALAVAAVFGSHVLETSFLATVAVVLATGHRTLLQWKSLLALLILVILFIPIRRYTMPGNLPFELEPYRLLVAFLTGAWVASMLVDRRVRLRRSGLEAPLLAFAVIALASVIVNGERVRAVEPEVTKSLAFFASFVLVLYIVVSVVRSLRDVDFLVRLLVLGGAALSVLAVFEARAGTNVFNHLGGLPFLELAEAPSIRPRGARLRVYASAQHAIALGAALVMLIPLAVYLARTSSRRWWLAAGLLLLGALAPVSRTSLLMLVVVAGVFLWLRPRETRRLWPALIPAILVIHFAVPGTLGTLRASFFPEGGLIAQQKISPGGRGSGRLADLAPSLEEFWEKPLLGHGFGTRVVKGPRENALILDNQWLALLVETGALGVAALAWLFLFLLRRTAIAARCDESARGWLLTAITASISSFAVAMVVFDAFSFIQVTFLLFILMAFGAVLSLETKPVPRAPANLHPAHELAPRARS